MDLIHPIPFSTFLHLLSPITIIKAAAPGLCNCQQLIFLRPLITFFIVTGQLAAALLLLSPRFVVCWKWDGTRHFIIGFVYAATSWASSRTKLMCDCGAFVSAMEVGGERYNCKPLSSEASKMTKSALCFVGLVLEAGTYTCWKTIDKRFSWVELSMRNI